MRGAVHADEALTQYRLIENAQYRPAGLLQRDQLTPFMAAGDKGAGAIQGIQHPAIVILARCLAELLAQDGVVRPFFGDQVPDGAFGAAIGFGDGIESVPALLVRDIDALAEIRPDRRAAGIGKPIGERDQAVIHHYASALARLRRWGL